MKSEFKNIYSGTNDVILVYIFLNHLMENGFMNGILVSLDGIRQVKNFRKNF